MGRAKEIVIKVIPSSIANPFIRQHHYSGKVVNNSVLHFGAFLDGGLHGVLSYGNSLDKSKIIGLVKGTKWNEFLELNRMAFDDYLPRNSESRSISQTIKLIKKNAPQVKWIISFADACSCGDGTIYRASGFVLTGIKKNFNLCRLKSGEVIHKMTLESNPTKPRPELGGLSYYDVTGGDITSRNIWHTSEQNRFKGSSSVIYISSTRNAESCLRCQKFRSPRLMSLELGCTRVSL